MRVFSFLVVVQLLSSFVYADPLYVTVKGEISRILDRTPEKELSYLSIGDAVQYTFLIDTDFSGYHTSSGKKIQARDRLGNSNSYSDYSFADYICGDLINGGYYGYEYFVAESRKSYSSERLKVDVGKRLSIQINNLLENIRVGDSGKSINYFRPPNRQISQSNIESNVRVVSVDLVNPCQN